MATEPCARQSISLQLAILSVCQSIACRLLQRNSFSLSPEATSGRNCLGASYPWTNSHVLDGMDDTIFTHGIGWVLGSIGVVVLLSNEGIINQYLVAFKSSRDGLTIEGFKLSRKFIRKDITLVMM